MNGKKAALVAGLAAIAVVAWMLVRGGDRRDATAPAPSAPGPVASAGGSPASDDRIRPVRPPIHVGPGGVAHDLEPAPAVPAPDPVIVDAAPHPSLANGFDADSRDADFADAHEHEIDKRLAALHADGVQVAATECRGHQCRITITAADDRALGHFVGQLEQPEGLNGYAQMIVLEAVTDTDDGKRRERVYARFE